jgi:paraquat-inducible protein A
MAEIFLIGAGVSLVKVAGLASVTPGPAFWALGGLVVVIGFENAAFCRESLWSAVGRAR